MLRGFGKKNPSGVVTQQDYRGAMFGIVVVERTSESHFQIKDLADGRRVSLEDHIFRAISAAAYVRRTGPEMRLKNAHRGGGRRHVRELGNVVCPLGLQLFAVEPFAGRPRERRPGKAISDDGVRTQFADAT